MRFNVHVCSTIIRGKRYRWSVNSIRIKSFVIKYAMRIFKPCSGTQSAFAVAKGTIVVRFNSNSALCRQNGGCTGGLSQGIRPLPRKPEITEHYVSAPITFGSSACIYTRAYPWRYGYALRYESRYDCSVYTVRKYAEIRKASDTAPRADSRR